MALVFVAALAYSFFKKDTGGGKIDPQTGLPMGTNADQQALQQLQQLQNAASRSGGGAGGSQTPPTIIQNYPASTQITTAFPLHGSAFGNNGSPSWPVHAPRARKGGPGPRGPGHKPWEHGDHGFNGGEPHHEGGGPGAGHDDDRDDHQGDGGHHGDQDDHGGRPGWGGDNDHGGGWGGGGGDNHDGDHGGRGGDNGGGGHGRGGHGR
jgi:hypothetical protein